MVQSWYCFCPRLILNVWVLALSFEELDLLFAIEFHFAVLIGG